MGIEVALAFEIVEANSFVTCIVELGFSAVRRLNILIDRCVFHLLKVFNYAKKAFFAFIWGLTWLLVQNVVPFVDVILTRNFILILNWCRFIFWHDVHCLKLIFNRRFRVLSVHRLRNVWCLFCCLNLNIVIVLVNNIKQLIVSLVQRLYYFGQQLLIFILGVWLICYFGTSIMIVEVIPLIIASNIVYYLIKFLFFLKDFTCHFV